MPRKNRFTVKTLRRPQRSKHLLNDEQAYWRTMHPRPDERGAARIVIGLALILVGLVAAVVTAPQANARAVEIRPAHPKSNEWCHTKCPVLYVEHVQGQWYWIELADNSAWMVTRCRNDEITGRPHQSCWWNARTMGNGEGHHFLVLDGRKHRTVRGTVIR